MPLPTVGATVCLADELQGPWSPLRRRYQPTEKGSPRNMTAVPPLLLLDLESDAASEGRDCTTYILFNFRL